MGAYLTLHKYD